MRRSINRYLSFRGYFKLSCRELFRAYIGQADLGRLLAARINRNRHENISSDSHGNDFVEGIINVLD